MGGPNFKLCAVLQLLKRSRWTVSLVRKEGDDWVRNMVYQLAKRHDIYVRNDYCKAFSEGAGLSVRAKWFGPWGGNANLEGLTVTWSKVIYKLCKGV